MADKIQLEIVTPKGAVVDEAVDIVTAPGVDGEFGVLANHAPMLSTIRIGLLTYRQGSDEHHMMVSGGFCQVAANKATFLVETAELGHDIDIDRALQARERAEKRLAAARRKEENINIARAEAALERALARIKAHQKKR